MKYMTSQQIGELREQAETAMAGVCGPDAADLGLSVLLLLCELADRAADVLDAARALAIRLRANGVTTLTAEEFALLAAVDAQAGRRVVD